jgi:hypothetical protein
MEVHADADAQAPGEEEHDGLTGSGTMACRKC